MNEGDKRVNERELEKEWERVRPLLEKIPPEEVAQSIRENRDSK